MLVPPYETKGSGTPVTGMIPIDHADVLEHLEGEPADDAGGHQRAEQVFGAHRDSHRAPEQDSKQQQ